MSDGSRWYFPVFEGLFDAKHVKQMGQALWLYGWIVSRAWAAQRGGLIAYSHEEVAVELGVTSRTIKAWFSQLQQHSYLITRARHPYSLDVEVTKWRTVEEWLNARQAERSEGIFTTEKRSEERSEERSEGTFTPSITIRLLSYEYSTGAGAQAATMSGAFAGLLERLKETDNKAALLRQIYSLCFTGDPPEYGYLGKTARAVGGAGRLAEIMWQLTTKPPTGDVMAYILKVYGRNSKDRNNGHRVQHSQIDVPLTPEQELMNKVALGERQND